MENHDSILFVKLPPKMPKRKFMLMYLQEANHWVASFNDWIEHLNEFEALGNGEPHPKWESAEWIYCTHSQSVFIFRVHGGRTGMMRVQGWRPYERRSGLRRRVDISKLVWGGWVMPRPVRLRDGQVLYVG